MRGPRGAQRRRPLPILVATKLDHCALCLHGYLHMMEIHGHGVGTVMVITPDGLTHCTVCHGRGIDLDRVGQGMHSF